MNDILSDERMRDALTENIWRYLTVLYIEKKGGSLTSEMIWRTGYYRRMYSIGKSRIVCSTVCLR